MVVCQLQFMDSQMETEEELNQLIEPIITKNVISIQTYSVFHTKYFNYAQDLRKNNINVLTTFLHLIKIFIKSISSHLLKKNDIDNANTFLKLSLRFISIFNIIHNSQKYNDVLLSIFCDYGYTKKWALLMIDKLEDYNVLLTFIEPLILEIQKNEEFINMEIVQQFLYYTCENKEMDKIVLLPGFFRFFFFFLFRMSRNF